MNSVKKSPLLWGINLGKIIDSKVGNPMIVYVQGNEKIDLTTLIPKEYELVLDDVSEELVYQAERLGITIRTLLLHKPISRQYNNVRIYESKILSVLDNLPKYKCRWEVPDIKTLLKSNMQMWYICREPKDSTCDFYNELGKRMKTIEDNQYEITYFNDKNKWLYTIYRDTFLEQ
ncbi:hypothetical protein M2132_002242 [Dysgonomonas sp. PH5-45]|uniref:hypothetical protein n=1 Tax=unclassified Dysgonomonas TaxID=2630389 RepID=UPI0024764AB7|nr:MULTISPECIES: hypothetical protein [unclassified Dysgonomonas]MDH6355892.1 hypothetical protein [Dysgonomonas sp. PH5-45]MDH6388800.1 hypothetical protein [Dysgonomonas sp. PH5-37]